MTTLWIVHRDPRQRSALIRAAGSPEGAVCGAPGDPIFAASPAPDVVVLGVAGDFEAELEFAHQTALRAPRTRWILAPPSGQADRARALFDAIDAALLGDPPDARSLRERIHSASAAAPDRAPLALSRRPARDAIAQRFARWFADVELPELLRALDPQLGDVPLVIRGEAGTGRGLLAHYVHLFGAEPWSELVHVPCERGTTGAALRRALGDALGGALGGTARRCTIWLEDVDSLPRATQRELARWIELGLPSDSASARVVRWIASSGDEVPGLASALDAALRDALAGLALRVPTLRERPAHIAVFANQTALAWCSARRQRPRRFAEDALAALAEYAWPLNLRELEAVVVETLAARAADPLRADDLQYDGFAFAPLDASAIGALIDAEPAARGRGDAEPQREPARSVAERASEPRPPAAARRDEAPMHAPRTATHRDEAHAHRPPAAPPREVAERAGELPIQELAAALAHEMRNPLSTIRTFAELLPSRYDDPEFRSRFAELVGEDARRVEAVVERLSQLAALGAPSAERVDIAALLEQLLAERIDAVRDRELLVLKELEPQHAVAVGDPAQLRFALESLVEKSLELAPDGGDVFIAAHHHATALSGEPAVRVLVRFGNHDIALAGARVPGSSPAENALAYAVAAAVIRGQRGRFSIDTGEGNETVLVVDLPA